MKVFLKLNGHYVGVEPGTSKVYADRAAGGGWEEVELAPKDGGLFIATFVAANLVLSVQPDGRLETRPAGTDGPFELLRATSQPEGLDILYREDGGQVLGEPLTIEAVE